MAVDQAANLEARRSLRCGCVNMSSHRAVVAEVFDVAAAVVYMVPHSTRLMLGFCPVSLSLQSQIAPQNLVKISQYVDDFHPPK